ncbi:MAG TPA: tripartite tricarboxylate transporter permease [Candidatus Limnocylindria bacterium]|nr:tripartite tricarboxylate transporter permease [Candidatus Limnocylindria bacterium]
MLLTGLQVIIQPQVLLVIVMGVILGVIFGALPGVSATMAIVLCISFTYSMDPVVAIAFLAAVYCASITGGSITAILFKIPGTPSSAPTTLDGYPMAQRGEAGKALTLALVGSGIGGLFSALVMYLLTQPLMSVALRFNSAEQFAVSALGIGILAFVDSDRPLNTFVSGLIGIWIATIGQDRLSYVPRFTFGSVKLLDGIESLPFMIGMFAVVEIFGNIRTPVDNAAMLKEGSSKFKLSGMGDLVRAKWTALRSAVLGTFVGVVPGAGATIASFMSYSVESKMNKSPETMGKGNPAGIIASEVANNAATGGAMVPLLSMGIPGSNAAAMMMTALAIHGVQMGPLLLKSQPEYLSATFMSMIFANIAMIFISIVVAKVFAKVLKVPYYILGPLILVLALTGAYAFQSNMFDLYVLFVAGVVGYFFKKFGFNISALILGMVLGVNMEYYFGRALLMYGNIGRFFERPIFTGIVILFALIIVYTVAMNVRKKRAKKN